MYTYPGLPKDKEKSVHTSALEHRSLMCVGKQYSPPDLEKMAGISTHFLLEMILYTELFVYTLYKVSTP